jgi:hypothetical protein
MQSIFSAKISNAPPKDGPIARIATPVAVVRDKPTKEFLQSRQTTCKWLRLQADCGNQIVLRAPHQEEIDALPALELDAAPAPGFYLAVIQISSVERVLLKST